MVQQVTRWQRRNIHMYGNVYVLKSSQLLLVLSLIGAIKTFSYFSVEVLHVLSRDTFVKSSVVSLQWYDSCQILVRQLARRGHASPRVSPAPIIRPT